MNPAKFLLHGYGLGEGESLPLDRTRGGCKFFPDGNFMKKYYLTVISFVCFGATLAQAQYYYLPEGAGMYVRASVGPSFYQDGRLTEFGGSVSAPVHYETGGIGEAAVGWDFNRYVSVEFQTGVQGTRIDNVPGYAQYHSDVYNVPFLANFTLAYPIPHTIITPYIGGGAGGADTSFDAHSFGNNTATVYGSENDVVYAWQAFAGLRFNLTPDIAVGAAYQYFTTGNTTYSYPPGPNLNVGFNGVRTHSVMFTFEWKFW